MNGLTDVTCPALQINCMLEAEIVNCPSLSVSIYSIPSSIAKNEVKTRDLFNSFLRYLFDPEILKPGISRALKGSAVL